MNSVPAPGRHCIHGASILRSADKAKKLGILVWKFGENGA
jgi:hypothetical protein